MAKQIWIVASAALTLLLTACGGGGSDSNSTPITAASPAPTPSPSPSPTLPATPLYSVSTVTPVPYPAGYMVTTTDPRDVNTDPCRLNLDVVTYPQTWIGRRTLPAASNAPLDPAIGRGVVIKDIMLDNNPGFVLQGAPDAPNGCNNGAGALRGEFVKTANRIASLKAGYVKITQWHWATINDDGSYGIVKADNSFGPLSDANLAAFVQAAHAAGLKVVLWNQIQGFTDKNGNNIPTPASNPVNYRKWFAAFRPFMLERAAYYQSIGADVWDTACDYCVFYQTQNKSDADIALFYDENLAMVKAVKQVFKGKSYIAANEWISHGTEYLNYIDFIEAGMWWNKNYTLAESDVLTVADFRSTINSNILQALGYGKPVFVGIGMQSRRTALSSPGYMEETACTAAIGDIQTSNTKCIQRGTETDFSLQAIVIQAQLEYIKSLNRNNLVVFANDYLVTDPLTPQTAFPNIAYSIRNKPAEGVVRTWFSR
ncbi:MAG: glycoside hydrolase family 113 [Novosphingobium sp.]